jgi:hypothetical protein
MRSPYDPAAPTLADLQHLLSQAHPTLQELAKDREAAEAMRARAYRLLCELARNLLVEADLSDAPKTGWELSRFAALPPELAEDLKIAGLRILLDGDPEEALRRFLGRSREAHRPRADNKDRDAKITLDVESRVNLGMSIRAASEEVAAQARRGRAPIDAAMVRKIHKANRDTPEVQMVLWVLRGDPRTTGNPADREAGPEFCEDIAPHVLLGPLPPPPSHMEEVQDNTIRQVRLTFQPRRLFGASSAPKGTIDGQ